MATPVRRHMGAGGRGGRARRSGIGRGRSRTNVRPAPESGPDGLSALGAAIRAPPTAAAAAAGHHNDHILAARPPACPIPLARCPRRPQAAAAAAAPTPAAALLLRAGSSTLDSCRSAPRGPCVPILGPPALPSPPRFSPLRFLFGSCSVFSSPFPFLVPCRARAGGAMSILTQPFDADEFRTLAHHMVDFIADYHRDIARFPVRSQVEPGYLQKLLPESAPDEPEALEDILKDVQSKIVPGVTHWQSPNFFGYYPSNGSTAGFLGEMLSGGFNIVGFSWITSPAATELEMIVLDWLGKLLQLPNEFLSPGKGGGVIQGTASEAVLVVMLAARKRAVEKVTKDQGISEFEALGKLVAYTSDQAHSCVNKASQIAGIGVENLRLIPTDASTNYSMSPEILAKTVAADVAAGFVPFFLCGVVGSTSSAAVDPLSELGDIAKEYGMWFHVDGAYAGNACICPEYRPHLNGVEKADSFNMNPHKWLLTNFDCSTLWVKDPTLLVAALSTNPVFLRNKQSDNNLVVDYKDWQIPLGRRFRSLKLWMVMRMYGSTGLRAYIRNHCDIAKHFEELLRTDSRFEVMAPRTFSLICFRLKPLSNDADNGYSLNAKLEEALNCSGDVLVTHTVLGGLYTIRFAVGGARTELRHVDAAWEVIQLQASQLLNE